VTEIAERKQQYLNKITSQHKIRPKFMTWLAATLDFFDDLMDVAEALDPAFDLDTAVGAQLDIIGHTVGIRRLLTFEPEYAPPLLPDDMYRIAIKAKISLNQWDGTTRGIYELWEGIFPEYQLYVRDNQDMTMTLVISDLENLFISEYMATGQLAPKPQGVLVNYEFVLTRYFEATLYIGSGPPTTKAIVYSPEPEIGLNVGPAELHHGGAVVITHSFIFFGSDDRRPPDEILQAAGASLMVQTRAYFESEERSEET
jgi:hypothetical protein